MTGLLLDRGQAAGHLDGGRGALGAAPGGGRPKGTPRSLLQLQILEQVQQRHARQVVAAAAVRAVLRRVSVRAPLRAAHSPVRAARVWGSGSGSQTGMGCR